MSKRLVRTAAAVLGTAVVGGLLTAAPAEAASSYQGRVTTSVLTVRHLPTTASASEGTVKKGQTIEIVCKVRGTTVAGNNIWYALPPTLNEWVSARYVDNLGPAPRWCGTEARWAGKANAALNKRVAPTTAAAKAGSLAKGQSMSIICKLNGQNVGGNPRWYYLTDGRWVAARYVDNIGVGAPGWCN